MFNDINIETGGIYSNSCLVKKGNSGDIYADDGSYYVDYLEDPHGKFQDDTFDADHPLTMLVPAPGCGDLSAGITQTKKTIKAGDTLEVWPGIYSGGIAMQGKLSYIKMHPGLYCLDGDFSANSGSITLTSTDMEEGITIYLRSGADFDIGGNAHVELRAAHAGFETAPAIPGMLIFMQEDYTGFIRLRGDSTSSYRGTVYGKSAEIDLGL